MCYRLITGCAVVFAADVIADVIARRLCFLRTTTSSAGPGVGATCVYPRASIALACRIRDGPSLSTLALGPVTLAFVPAPLCLWMV